MTSISDTEVVNAPGGLVELGYSKINTSVVLGTSSGVVIPAISVYCDGSPILVEFYAIMTTVGSGSGSYGLTQLVVDGVVTGRLTQSYTANTLGAIHFGGCYGSQRLTPSVGIHTFGINGYRGTAATAEINAGSGVGDDYPPAFIRISKITQASQLLVTQSNAPIVTSLPSGNLVTGQEVDLYSTSPYAGYQRNKWDGTQWNIMGDSRANTSWQTYNPIFKQGASTISSTISYARYMVMGKTCFVRTRIVASGAGTAPNIISTTVPIAPLNAGYVNGIFVFSDVNPGVNYAALTPVVGSDLVVYGYGFQRGNGFGADPSLAVASGDVIEIALTYEVA